MKDMNKNKTSKKLSKLMERATMLQQALDETKADLDLTKIKIQKEIEQGTTAEYMGYQFQHKAGAVRTRLDSKALKEAHPTIFEEFTVESTTKPSLTIVKPKVG